EKPVRTAGLGRPSRRSPGEPAPPRLLQWLGPGPPCPQGPGGAITSREGRHGEIWMAAPRFPHYTCPALTAQSGSSRVRSPGTREATSGSLRPAGITPGAGRAPLAGWHEPRGESRDPRALGGEPGWPRAEPLKELEPGPGPGPAPALGWARGNELRHRLSQSPFPRLSLASGRCRAPRRLGAISPLETPHPPSVLLP
ncbi:hypothetical protein Nmel_014488, partial [Mimus melanotis]